MTATRAITPTTTMASCDFGGSGRFSSVRDEGTASSEAPASELGASGTILGGVWADSTWGRFWGWDPKENGALMIVLLVVHVVYALTYSTQLLGGATP